MAKLYFNYGAMNAGKSTILLQSAYNYSERGMHTMLLKPEIDTRDGDEETITCRIGLSAKAHSFCTEKDLQSAISDYHIRRHIDCIFVDEAQFLTEEQVWQLASVADHLGIPVMCYGLRTDFRGKLFPGSAALLAIADSVKELKTLCWCGRKAIMTLRMNPAGQAVKRGQQVQIGGNDRYISLCRLHWSENKSKADVQPLKAANK